MKAVSALPNRNKVALVLIYTAVVLGIDMLALYGCHWGLDWRNCFAWRLSTGFDLYKFITWFVIPFAVSFRWMDWGYFGIKRWQRRDVYILVSLAGAGILAMLVIPFVPSLHATYPGWSRFPAITRWHLATGHLVWTFSWLIGWEFLHRYTLARTLAARWPHYGWLIVPLFEGLYHLQKALPEAAGMVVFSLFVTRWSLQRRNVLLPFLAHLFIELENLAFLLLT